VNENRYAVKKACRMKDESAMDRGLTLYGRDAVIGAESGTGDSDLKEAS
jgi:hypothetical protein